MLLQLVVNNGSAIRASLNGKGLLSAHLNVSIGSKKGDAATVRLNVIDETDEPNSVYSTWEAGALSAGDKVEICLLPNGEADPPSEVRRTSESPKNLFSSQDQARLMLDALMRCDGELSAILERARTAEPKEEFEKIARAVGSVICEMDRLIVPTLRRHPELVEEARRKKLWNST